MRVLVCGGRDYDNQLRVSETLDALCDEFSLWGAPDREGNRLPDAGRLAIIHGGARGADALADRWAVSNWVTSVAVEANWSAFGKAAGPIRNQSMIDSYMPDLVLAFPGGRGTADMIRRAKEAGIEVREITA